MEREKQRKERREKNKGRKWREKTKGRKWREGGKRSKKVGRKKGERKGIQM